MSTVSTTDTNLPVDDLFAVDAGCNVIVAGSENFNKFGSDETEEL